jgi:hypothetical protein
MSQSLKPEDYMKYLYHASPLKKHRNHARSWDFFSIISGIVKTQKILT